MKVEQSLDKRKWILLGEQVKTMFRRTPPLTFMFGSLDTSPPEPKVRLQSDVKDTQVTLVYFNIFPIIHFFWLRKRSKER